MHLCVYTYLCTVSYYLLVTFTLLTTGIISYQTCLPRCILLIFRLQQVFVLLCHPMERATKTDTNCHIPDQFLSTSSKMHKLLGLFNIYSQKCPQHNQKYPELLVAHLCFLPADTEMAEIYLELWERAQQKEKSKQSQDATQ